jgi:hypothetical protein
MIGFALQLQSLQENPTNMDGKFALAVVKIPVDFTDCRRPDFHLRTANKFST